MSAPRSVLRLLEPRPTRPRPERTEPAEPPGGRGRHRQAREHVPEGVGSVVRPDARQAQRLVDVVLDPVVVDVVLVDVVLVDAGVVVGGAVVGGAVVGGAVVGGAVVGGSPAS